MDSQALCHLSSIVDEPGLDVSFKHVERLTSQLGDRQLVNACDCIEADS